MKYLFTILLAFSMLSGIAQEKDLRLAICKENGKTFLLEKDKKHTFYINNGGYLRDKISVVNYEILDTNWIQLFFTQKKLDENDLLVRFENDTIIALNRVTRIKTNQAQKAQRIIGLSLIAVGGSLTGIGAALSDEGGGGGGWGFAPSEGALPLLLGIPTTIGGIITTLTSYAKRTFVFQENRDALGIVEIGIAN